MKIQPSDAKMLSQLFYGTDTPPEDKSDVNATDNGNLIPANQLPRSIALTINGTNDKIWLVIRYKGTPSQTLERITVSVS